MSWNFDEIVERIENLEDTSDLFKSQIQNLQENIIELYADVDEYRRQSRLAKYWRQYMLDNNDSKVSPYTIGNFNDIVDLYEKIQPTITSRGVVAQTNVISDFSEENKSLQFVATEFTGDNKFPISYSYKLDLVSKVAEDVTLNYELFIGNYYFNIGTGNNWNAATSAVSVQEEVDNYSVIPEGLYTIRGSKGDAILVGNVVMPASDIVVTYQGKTLLFNGVPVFDRISVGTVRSGVVACKSYDQFLVQMGQKLKGIKLKNDVDASSQPANKLNLRRIADSTQIGTLNPYMHFSINKVENDQVIVEDITTFWGIAYDNDLDFHSSNKFTLYEEGVVAARLFYNPMETKIAADSRRPIVLSNTRDSVTFAFLEEFKFSRIQQELWVTEDVMKQYRQSLSEKYEDSVITSQVLRSLALVERLIGSVPTLEPVESKGITDAVFLPHNMRVQTPYELLRTYDTTGTPTNPHLVVYGLPAPGTRQDSFTASLYEDEDVIVIVAGRKSYVDSTETQSVNTTARLIYTGPYQTPAGLVEAHFEPVNGKGAFFTPYKCSTLLTLDNVYIAIKTAAGQATNTTGSLQFAMKVGTVAIKGSSTTVGSSTVIWNGKQYYCLSVPVNSVVQYDNTTSLNLLYDSPVGDPRKEAFNTAFGVTVPGNPIVHTFDQTHPGLATPEIGQGLPITPIAYNLNESESLNGVVYNMNVQGYPTRKFYGMGGYIQVQWDVKGSVLVYPEGSRVINRWYDDSTSSLVYATQVLQNQIDTFLLDQITITQKVEWVTQAFTEFASQFQTEKRSLWQRFRSLVISITLNYLSGIAIDIFTQAIAEVVTHAVTKTKYNTYAFHETSKHPSTQLQISTGHINLDKYATENISKDMIIDSLGKSKKYKEIQSDSTKTYKNSYGKQTLDAAEQQKLMLDWSTSGTSSSNTNVFPGLSADPTDIVGNRVDVIYRPLTSLPKPIGNWAHTSITESALEKSADSFNTSSTRLPSHAYITAQQSYFNVSTGKPNVDRHVVGIGEANSQGKPTGDKGAGVGGVTFGFEVTHIDSNGKYILRPKKASEFGYTDDEVFRIYGTLFGFKNIPGDANRAWNEICVSLNSKYMSGTTYKTIYPSSNLISNSMYELTRNPPRWDYNLLNLNCQNFTQDVINILEGGTANHLPPNTVYNMLYLKIKGIDNALDDQTIARLIDRLAHCFYAPKRYNGCVIDEVD